MQQNLEEWVMIIFNLFLQLKSFCNEPKGEALKSFLIQKIYEKTLK